MNLTDCPRQNLNIRYGRKRAMRFAYELAERHGIPRSRVYSNDLALMNDSEANRE